MKGLRPRMACVGLVCAVGVWTCPEVDAQSTAARSTGSGMMMVPVPMPLFPPAVSNGSSDSGPAAGGMSAQANVFSNPYAAAFLYSSMLPPSQVQTPEGSSPATPGASPAAGMGLSPAQMGLMMLSTQRPMGIGSGQLSGTRPGPGGDRHPSRSPTTTQQARGRSRTAGLPGGVAASYFNRTSPRSSYPRSYFNRPNPYFP